MRLLSLALLLALIVLALRLGAGLLLLSRRTGGWPERCLGAAIVLKMLALALFATSRSPEMFGTPTANYLAAVGAFALSTAVLLVYGFTWIVFRQRDGVAVLFVAAGGALASGAGMGLVLAGWDASTMLEAMPQMRPYSIALLASIGAAYGWSSVEALRCWLRHRRQLRIGLGDPVVVNRFLLWVFAGGSVAWLCLVLTGLQLLGVVVMQDTAALAATGAGGFVATASWWVTFFPPRW